jgi:hypothetical protein
MSGFARIPRRTTSSLIRDLRWSGAEKVIARQVFERALRSELEDTKQEVEKRVAMIAHAEEMWDVEEYMTRRRREINYRYDFRYSVLPEVFGELLRAGRVGEEDLRGLDEEKLKFIRAYAKRRAS